MSAPDPVPLIQEANMTSAQSPSPNIGICITCHAGSRGAPPPSTHASRRRATVKNRTCSYVHESGEECGRRHLARGYCELHYQRWLRGSSMGAAIEEHVHTISGADIATASTKQTASAISITTAHGEAGRIWTPLSREGEGRRNERTALCAPKPAGHHQLLRWQVVSVHAPPHPRTRRRPPTCEAM